MSDTTAPPPPAYCVRMTPEEAAAASREETARALAELAKMLDAQKPLKAAAGGGANGQKKMMGATGSSQPTTPLKATAPLSAPSSPATPGRSEETKSGKKRFFRKLFKGGKKASPAKKTESDVEKLRRQVAQLEEKIELLSSTPAAAADADPAPARRRSYKKKRRSSSKKRRRRRSTMTLASAESISSLAALTDAPTFGALPPPLPASPATAAPAPAPPPSSAPLPPPPPPLAAAIPTPPPPAPPAVAAATAPPPPPPTSAPPPPPPPPPARPALASFEFPASPASGTATPARRTTPSFSFAELVAKSPQTLRKTNTTPGSKHKRTPSQLEQALLNKFANTYGTDSDDESSSGGFNDTFGDDHDADDSLVFGHAHSGPAAADDDDNTENVEDAENAAPPALASGTVCDKIAAFAAKRIDLDSSSDDDDDATDAPATTHFAYASRPPPPRPAKPFARPVNAGSTTSILAARPANRRAPETPVLIE